MNLHQVVNPDLTVPQLIELAFEYGYCLVSPEQMQLLKKNSDNALVHVPTGDKLIFLRLAIDSKDLAREQLEELLKFMDDGSYLDTSSRGYPELHTRCRTCWNHLKYYLGRRFGYKYMTIRGLNGQPQICE